jgi:hypothetical protein
VYKSVSVAAAAFPSGLVSFYDTAGELMLQYDTGHQNITSMGFDGMDGTSHANSACPLPLSRFCPPPPSHTEPLLVTCAADGSAHLHNLTLWRHDLMVAGRRPRVDRAVVVEGGGANGEPSFEALKAVMLKPPEMKTTAGYGLAVQLEQVLDAREREAPRVLSSIVYKHRSLGRMAVTGDQEGTIKFYARNGTLVKVRPDQGLGPHSGETKC